MRSTFIRKLLPLLVVLGVAGISSAQTLVNPVSQIRWSAIVGSGAPTATCQGSTPPPDPATQAAPGQNYVDQTNTKTYTCLPSGGGFAWVVTSAGGNPLTPAPQYSLFYQPTSGTAAAATGNLNATTDGNGNIKSISVNSKNTPVTWYGAKSGAGAYGDGNKDTTCTLTASSTTVVCADGPFLPTDVDLVNPKKIGLVHGGVNPGGTYNVAPTLVTTITGYVSPTTVTVATAPSNSVQGPVTYACNTTQYSPIIAGCTGGTFNYGDIDKGPFTIAGDGPNNLNDSNLTIQTGQFISTSSMYISFMNFATLSGVSISVPGATVIWGHDDTTAIQNGVNMSCSTGWGFILEPGRYITTATTLPCPSLYMIGTGTGDAILSPIGPGVNAIFYGSTANQIANLYFAHFQIDGSGMRNASFNTDIGKGLVVDNARNLWVEDMYIHHTATTALATDQSQAATIRNNAFDWCGLESTFLSNSQLGSACIGDGTSTYNVMPHLIDGNSTWHCGSRCIFIESQNQLSYNGIYDLPSYNNRIVNNSAAYPIVGPGYFNANNGYCIGDQGASNTIIANNVCSYAPIGIKISGNDISRAAYAQSPLVIGNQVYTTWRAISGTWATGDMNYENNILQGSLYGTSNPGIGVEVVVAQTQFACVTLVRSANVSTCTVAQTIQPPYLTNSLINVYGAADSTYNCTTASALCYTVTTVGGTAGAWTVAWSNTGTSGSTTGAAITSFPGYALTSFEVAGGKIEGFPGPGILMDTAHGSYAGFINIHGVNFVNNGGSTTTSKAAVGFTGVSASINRLRICNNTYYDSRSSTQQNYAFYETSGQVTDLEFCSGEATGLSSGTWYQSSGTPPSILLMNDLPYYPSNIIPDSSNSGFTWTVTSPLTFVPGVGVDGRGGYQYTGTGSATGAHTRATSRPFALPAGTYTLSGNINAANTVNTSGQALVEITSTDFTTYVCSVISVQATNPLFGVSTTCTIPSGGLTVVASFDMNGVGVSSGLLLTMSAPMLRAGTAVGPYRANDSVVPTVITGSGTTPAINAMSGDFTITLTGNTTPTLSGTYIGQNFNFQVCQGSTVYTLTYPAAMHGGACIGSACATPSTANTCTNQLFHSFNGTTLVNMATINVAP